MAEPVDLCTQGRYEWTLRTEDGLRRSEQCFLDAIQQNPAYALAHAGLADAYAQMGAYGFMPVMAAYTQAAEAALQAIQLQDSLAEGHASLGFVQTGRREWADAEASFQRAIARNPGYAPAHHWYSICLTQLGRFADAMAEIETALAIDGGSLRARAQRGAVLVMDRKYADAAVQFEQILAESPNFALAYRFLAQTYTHMGRYADAHARLDDVVQRGLIPATDRDLLEDRAYVLAKEGATSGAAQIAVQLAARYNAAVNPDKSVVDNVATIYAALGDATLALEWLTRAVQDNDPDLGYLKVDPKWDPVRQDQEISGILATL